MNDAPLSAAERGSCLSELEIIAIQHLPRHAPYTIIGVSRSQLSVARYAGGCEVYGEMYRYMPETDELIRDDVFRLVSKLRRQTRKREQARGEQGGLPL